MAASESILVEMERLQDDVLSRLDELNARVEALLASENASPSALAVVRMGTVATA
jgi:hypothetical protein